MQENERSIAFDQECDACQGKGVYIGLAERDGASVVCRRCKGDGHYTYKHVYRVFTGLKPAEASRVYAVNPGVCVSATSLITPGGVTYAEWLKDPASPRAPGVELRENTCPAWWYQAAEYKKKPQWDECHSAFSFPRCEFFPAKDKCWERWDRMTEANPEGVPW